MEISIIIITRNNRDVLRRAIDTLLVQEFPRDQYEIIVVDGRSTDGTAEMVRAIECPVAIRHIMQPGYGKGAARNLGARAAQGRILLYLDSDVWADPGLLTAHHAHYLPGARRIAVQGVHPFHPDTLVTPFMKVKGISPDLTVRKQRNLSPYHVSGGNFSLLRVDLDDVGGFDEGYTGYGLEDLDLALRIHARGVVIEYDPRAFGYSYQLDTLEDARRKLREMGPVALYLWRKHGRSARLGMFLEILPVMLPLKWLVYRTPLIMPLLRWIVPRAETREWLLVLNECYKNLLQEAYYAGVFEALRAPREMAPPPAEGVRSEAAHVDSVPRKAGERSGDGKATREGVPAVSGRRAGSGPAEDRQIIPRSR